MTHEPFTGFLQGNITAQRDHKTQGDPVNPDHYRGFSNNAEVIDITENLTGNGAQAVQYIARATRIDGQIKGEPLEDLRKAEWFIRREIGRINGENNA